MSCVLYLNNNGNIFVSMLLALGIGLAFGVVHGLLISYLEIQPFIVTLAGMFFARGMTTILSVNPQKLAHEGVNALRANKIEIPSLGYVAKNGNLIPAKLEIGAIVALCVVVLVYLMLRHMKLGRHIYALGGNQQSALMLGINVKRTRFISYVISGLLSGLALFLYGISLMGDGLSKLAGDKLQKILYQMTGSPVKGILLGIAVTALIQSSSATSVTAEPYDYGVPGQVGGIDRRNDPP